MMYFYAVLCVLGLSAGQILFKVGAAALSSGAAFFSTKPLAAISAAMVIYAVTSIAWVFILRNIDLGKIYPVMALAFILVPIGSHYIFNEKFGTQYFIGLILLIAGILIITHADSAA